MTVGRSRTRWSRTALLMLVIALLAGVTAPAAAQELPPDYEPGVAAADEPPAPAPEVSIEPAGPYAPAQSVVVTITNFATADYLVLWLCPTSAYGPDCGFVEYLEGPDGEVWRFETEVQSRFLGNDTQTLFDCRQVECSLVATESGQFEIGSVPQPIVAGAPLPPVTLALDTAPDLLVDQQQVSLVGSGFPMQSSLQISRCAWPVCDERSSYGYVDSDGSIEAVVTLRRIVEGVDCAVTPGRCQLLVTGDSLDYIGWVPLSFDPAVPPVDPPSLSIDPPGDLAHRQAVTITGERFGPGNYVSLQACDLEGTRCNYLDAGPPLADGSFSTNLNLSRLVGGQDCVEIGCELVAYSEIGEARLALDFDATLPPPPLPEIVVAPNTGLVDGQSVEVSLRNFDPNVYYNLRVCAEDTGCNSVGSGEVDGDGTLSLAFGVRRFLFPDADCAQSGLCSVAVSVYSGGSDVTVSAPIQFDPDAPLAPPADVWAYPTTGLWDGQKVRVRADWLLAGEGFQVRQCPEGVQSSNCFETVYERADLFGEVDTGVVVRAVVSYAGGNGQPLTADCREVVCSLHFVSNSGERVFPLEFDDGPAQAPYPRHLECVAWPTTGWPTGPIPAGVDPDEVQAAIDDALATDTSSIVVIHGGQLVAEGYDPGIDVDTINSSYSVSKSFTSTVIGQLVQEGYLELDAPAPVPEWSDPDDPRSAITLRQLLDMSSGLEWNESYSFGVDTDIIQMVFAPDSAAYAAAKPLTYEPGSRFDYSTGTTQILARIISQTLDLYGDDLLAELDARLFDVLGMDPEVGLDNANVWYGGTRTNMSTREFAKLGLLYLRGGIWEDEVFLDQAWVDYVKGPGVHGGSYSGQFWGLGPGRFRAAGLFGQGIYVAPDLDLVIAYNSPTGSGGGYTGGLLELFEDAAPASCSDDPVLTDDEASVEAAGSVDIDVLANDPAGTAELRPATLSIAERPNHGLAEVVDGTVRYQAGPGFTGIDTFTYYVCTTAPFCDEATVTVEVTPFAFELLRPGREVNRLRAGRTAVVEYRTRGVDEAVARAVIVTSQAADCESGERFGPVDEEQVRTRELGNNRDRYRLWWRTDRDDVGCRVLSITMADGVSHDVLYDFR